MEVGVGGLDWTGVVWSTQWRQRTDAGAGRTVVAYCRQRAAGKRRVRWVRRETLPETANVDRPTAAAAGRAGRACAESGGDSEAPHDDENHEMLLDERGPGVRGRVLSKRYRVPLALAIHCLFHLPSSPIQARPAPDMHAKRDTSKIIASGIELAVCRIERHPAAPVAKLNDLEASRPPSFSTSPFLSLARARMSNVSMCQCVSPLSCLLLLMKTSHQPSHSTPLPHRRGISSLPITILIAYKKFKPVDLKLLPVGPCDASLSALQGSTTTRSCQ